MSMQDTPDLVTEALDDNVLSLSLGAAPAHPLSLAMLGRLRASIERATSDSEVHVIVLIGVGRIFSAGHDMKEMSAHRADEDGGEAFVSKLFQASVETMMTLANCPKPTLAVVEGIATASGLQLACSCDMIFAGDQARFALPGVNNGGFCATPSVAVARKVAPHHVAEMTYSGEIFDADWALRTGLVNRVVAADVLYDQALAFAKALAARNMPPIVDGMAMLRAQQGLSLEDAYALAVPVMVRNFMNAKRIEVETVRWGP